MSLRGGVGNLVGAGALHTTEDNKISLLKIRRPSSARVHTRSTEHWCAAFPSVQDVTKVPKVKPLSFDPFSISLGHVQMQPLSFQAPQKGRKDSCEETARHL